MPAVLTKIALSIAAASTIAFSIPSTTTYTRPPETGTAIVAEITSYSSEPDQTDDTPFITASGTHVHDGTIACPQKYAFGTEVKIDGKTYTCEDRMNKKFPDRFDIWNESNEQAIAWGLQEKRIVVDP